jgi:hypothetical protein
VSAVIWDTRSAPDPSFERSWRARVAAAPFAHFALDPAFLHAEARAGRPATALLLEGDGRRGALVLREERGRLISGWPWRSQAIIDDPLRDRPPGLTMDEAHWLYDQALRFGAGRRLAVFLPHPPPTGIPGYAAGATLLHSIAHAEEVILRAMSKSRRRHLRRADEGGFEVREAEGVDDLRGYWEVLRATDRRHGRPPRVCADSPAPGEGWREWELPWMWLVVVRREGAVVAGAGYGLLAGGVLEARSGAAFDDVLDFGVMPLADLFAIRLARARGYRWINWGGDTEYKRSVTGDLGVRVRMHAWLGGRGRWWMSDRLESLARNARRSIVAWRGRVRGRIRAKDA